MSLSTSYDSTVIPYVLRCLIEEKHLLPSLDKTGHDCLFVYDLDALESGFASLIDAFPSHFVHCFAIKAAPMSFVVQAAIKAGLGIEAASLIELENGLRNECPVNKAVFDSPAKTYRELHFALEHGIHLNANSLEELDRIASVIAASSSSYPTPSVGLRINPLIGQGKIEELSVSTLSSKFGVNLIGKNKEAILSSFRMYPWLTGLHIHVGSQGFQMEQMAEGIKVMMHFANEIDETLGHQQVKILDIGGGLSANYESDAFSPSYAELAQVIQKIVPQLLTNSSRKVYTEFGRSLTAKAGWAVSRVEYSFDNHPTLRTAIIHVGADALLRECYTTKFPHRFTGYTAGGLPLEDSLDSESRPRQSHNISGPLCFAGDIIARSYPLPRIQTGDLIVIHDVGANSLALFSRHCSRPAPAIYGYRCEKGEKVPHWLKMVQEQESVEEVLNFWGSRRKTEGKEGKALNR